MVKKSSSDINAKNQIDEVVGKPKVENISNKIDSASIKKQTPKVSPKADVDVVPIAPKELPKFKIGTEEFTLSSNAQKHLSNFDGYKAKKGVKGCHNLEKFDKEVNDRLIMIDPKNGKIPHPTVRGVYDIIYKCPKENGKGGYFDPMEYHTPKNLAKKTVYDPKVISDDEMYQWGLEAMKNGKINSDGFIEGKHKGLDFLGYFDENTNEIRNFHPIFP